MIKSDRWIISMAQHRGMITPFVAEHVTAGLSFGAEGYGYDVRLGRRYQRVVQQLRATATGSQLIVQHIDPRNIYSQQWETLEIIGDKLWLAPGEFILGESVERFKIPRDAIMLLEGKSTYARCGLDINCTPFDPEWEGIATICIRNPTQHYVAVYPGLGIAKAIFLQSDEPCLLSYADKRGKYQGAESAQIARDGALNE